jgi:hypothetical protein
MSALIERLRKNGTDQYDPCGLCDEAADEIERLKAALKEAAKSLAEDEQEIERLQALVDGYDTKCPRCGAYYSTEIGYCTCGGA